MDEFEKIMSKHRKLQERNSNLLCSNENLIDPYAFLETSHEVVLTVVKSSQAHTCTCAPHYSIDLSCANSYCS
jgi:hypothetical protein